MYSYEGRTLAQYQSEIPGVVTSQRKWELEALIDVFIANKPKYIVEIGSQDGGTLYHWIKHAPVGAVIVNVDIMQNKSEADARATLDRWRGWVDARNGEVKLQTIIAPSQDDVVIHTIKQSLPEINFLFIDGDHTYNGVKADWENFSPMVNGVVAFHDLMTPTNGVQNHIQVGKLWREIQRLGFPTRELWAAEAQDWGGIGVVYHV